MRISYVTCALAIACLTAVERAATAEPCDVEIARAPVEVRTAVESALAIESHCRVALELRVVATEGGYYLLARDVHGHTRERIVPDTASAAVLVASWAADDTSDDRSPHVAPIERVAPPSPAAPFAPPGEPVDTATASSSHTYEPLVGVYGVVGRSGYGLRGELDLRRRGAWSLGIAIAGIRNEACTPFADDTGAFPMEVGTLQTTNVELLGYLSYERDLGDAWRLRGTLGAGAALVQATLMPIPSDANITWDGMLESNASGTTAAVLADASLSIEADIGRGFWLVGGVTVDASITAPLSISDSLGDGVQLPLARAVSGSLLLGLRHGL